MTAKIEGVKAKHAIVSPSCRLNKGDYVAGHEAVRHLIDEYMKLCRLEVNNTAKFNFVLTVERPKSE